MNDDALSKIGQAHFRSLCYHKPSMRTVTEADIAAVYEEAEAIYHDLRRQKPHPIDEYMAPELHQWAIRQIALNLIARQLGFDVDRYLRGLTA